MNILLPFWVGARVLAADLASLSSVCVPLCTEATKNTFGLSTFFSLFTFLFICQCVYSECAFFFYFDVVKMSVQPWAIIVFAHKISSFFVRLRISVSFLCFFHFAFPDKSVKNSIHTKKTPVAPTKRRNMLRKKRWQRFCPLSVYTVLSENALKPSSSESCIKCTAV